MTIETFFLKKRILCFSRVGRVLSASEFKHYIFLVFVFVKGMFGRNFECVLRLLFVTFKMFNLNVEKYTGA